MTISQTFTMGRLAHEWLKHELDPEFCRKVETVASGTGNIKTGSVLGKNTVGGAEAAPKAGGNTGEGSLTLDGATPVLAGAKPGVYAVRCVGTSANGGLFEVRDPFGAFVGAYAIGGPAFATEIKFSITDSGADFALGDGFDVTVAAGSGRLGWYDPTAVDGRAVPYGILLNAVDATTEHRQAVVIGGKAVINPLALTWGPAVDDANKRAAGVALLVSELGFETRAVV